MKNNLLLCVLQCLAISMTALAQENWTKYQNPVLRRSALFPDWKGLATSDAFVMKDGDTLKMWYSGSGWLKSSDDCPHVRIGYAWSLDGISWNEYPNNPVIDVGSNPADFDYDGIETPSVIKDLTAPSYQRYKLWYAGRHARCSTINDHQFGYAYSPDGIRWAKYSGNPILSAADSSSWYNTFISNPDVHKENGSYKMWFSTADLVLNNQPTDGKGNIGYASSTDGINWTVYPTPVLIAGTQNNWDSASISEPNVVKIGTTYHLFYSALNQWTIENFQVGYATSTDGINWVKSTNNPVLTIGKNKEWDRYWASNPAVIYDSTEHKFKMWFTGRDTANITQLKGYYWDIGYAESKMTSALNTYSNYKKSISIYPNPANDFINIQFSSVVKQVEIKIFNQFGQLLQTISSKNDININIKTSKLSNGMYFLLLNVDYQYVGREFIIRR